MRFRTRARLALATLLTLAVAGAFPGQSASASDGGRDGKQLTVMTQNLYLGSPLTPALDPNLTLPQFIGAVAQIYGTAVFTNFPKRAQAIADTVAAEDPDIIGLQEVSNWIAKPVPGSAAHPLSFDFLEILQGALAQRGLDYRVAAVSHNADIGPVPLVAPTFGCRETAADCQVTLQDRDVILVNADTAGLSVTASRSGNYAAQQTFQPPGLPGSPPPPPVSFNRGWAYIDASLNGTRFRFATTHLEVEDFPSIQEMQAQEFLAGPVHTGGPVIAVGDFNSAADPATTTKPTASYADLTKSWFKDAWDVNGGDPGVSCCQNGTLTNPTSQLQTRIDLVLTHGSVKAQSAHLVGNTPFSSTPPLWPSDHAGLVATLTLPGR